MWKFFTTKQWLLWSWGGTVTILAMLWGQVQFDVQINEWFGEFYDIVQKALAGDSDITVAQFYGELLTFGKVAAMWVALSLISSYFISHYLFRWRTAMVEWYHTVYDQVSSIEGASQRVQEDTVKFSRLMEGIFKDLIEAVMVLIEFIPILLGLSIGLNIAFFGDWQYGLAISSIIWAVGGTAFLLGLGWVLRLVGIEYDIQKKEAAYRKYLVKCEDEVTVPKTLEELFDDVRKISFKSYTRYLFFNVGRLAYLQTNVLVGYILLAPAIVAGSITLGVMQQILRAFGRVGESLQVILRSWTSVIELMSVYKRLKEFERNIK